MRAKQMMGSRNARRALKTFNYRYANGLRYQILIIRQWAKVKVFRWDFHYYSLFYSGFHSGDSCSSSESDSDNENENFNEDYDYQIQGSLHTVRQQRKIDLLIQRFQKYQDQHKKLVLAERNGQNSGEQISTTTHIVHWQPMPYCHITLKSTKEVAGYNTISEAFYKLDFCNAIRDIRRFNYISKLLHLLITQNLTSLSGCATKVLFTMLEQVAWQGTYGGH